MKNKSLAAALLVAGSIGLTGLGLGHGGSYTGPRDTVPPPGGGPPAGGPPASGPTGNPSGPGPNRPGSGGAQPGVPGGGTSPSKPNTGLAGADSDLTAWEFWWVFNKAPYLRLKTRLYESKTVTGSIDYYLGVGSRDKARDSMRPSTAQIHEDIVPALIRALQTQKHNDILTGAMIALAKIGDRRAEDGESNFAQYILPHLTSGEQEVAETAAVSLGILGNEKHLGLLEDLLRDRSNRLRQEHGVQFSGAVPMRTRAFAAFGLGLIGSECPQEFRPRIVSVLIETLASHQFAQRDVPAACLIALGLVPLPIGTPGDDGQLSGDPEQGVFTRAQEVRWLLEYFANEREDDLNRAHVPTAQARLMRDVPADLPLRAEVAEPLIAAIGRHSKQLPVIQQSCLLALGELGNCGAGELDGRIREALMGFSEYAADQQARRFALMAVARLGGRAGSVEPFAGLKDVRGFLIEQLAAGKAQTRPWAGLALGVLEFALNEEGPSVRTDEVARALRTSLERAKSPDEVGALSVACGLAGDPYSVDPLLSKLDQTRDVGARGYAAIGLGLVGDRKAVEPVQAVVEHAKFQPVLLREAAIALGLLGDNKAVPSLLSMLETAGSLSSQASIAQALGFIGDARSIPHLVRMLEDESKTGRARGFAAAALGIVAERDDLPWNSKISFGINYRANTETLTSPSMGTGILDML